MSIDSVLDSRYALWHDLLVNDFGYYEVAPPRPPMSDFELVIRAVRPQWGEVAPVTFDIRETWLVGTDRRLGIEHDDCMLVAASWNAQIVEDNGDGLGAERLDVDRGKPQPLWVHRHPLGEVNETREPAAALRHPAAWLEHIEAEIAKHYGYL